MLEHRAVLLFEKILVDVDRVVRVDSEKVPVIRGVMDLAHGKAVRHHGLSALVLVADDVGGVEQLSMTKMTDRALRLIRAQHDRSECRLVNPSLGEIGGPLALDCGGGG